jgi:integrase
MLRNWRRRVCDPALQRAGFGDLTPHELRHTAAGLAVAAGATVKAVQRMLGHASAAMTLDVYSGLFDGDLDAVTSRRPPDQRADPHRRMTTAGLCTCQGGRPVLG